MFNNFHTAIILKMKGNVDRFHTKMHHKGVRMIFVLFSAHILHLYEEHNRICKLCTNLHNICELKIMTSGFVHHTKAIVWLQKTIIIILNIILYCIVLYLHFDGIVKGGMEFFKISIFQKHQMGLEQHLVN